MAGPSPTYSAKTVDQAPDGRLFGSVFEKNAPPIIAMLKPLLAEVTGTVLEIGSGTGQHAAAFQQALPHMTWQASDREAAHRASILAWQRHHGLERREPLDIDALTDWATGLPSVDAVYSMNVVHIAPFEVAQGIFAGAAQALAPGGLLIFYGPFVVEGDFRGEGNIAFDARLRAADPSWGLRDLTEMTALAKQSDMRLEHKIDMPSNNLMLVFRRQARP